MKSVIDNLRAFPFPSNGKVHRKDMCCRQVYRTSLGFPFPSNGKVHRKPNDFDATDNATYLFPFPSNGKAYPKEHRTIRARLLYRFPFPSNGKAYPKTIKYLLTIVSGIVLFPFPSNGKVHRKAQGTRKNSLVQLCFHSLQTGKCIARANPNFTLPVGSARFHSLQTGKCIARDR